MILLSKEIRIAMSYVTKKYRKKVKVDGTKEKKEIDFWALRGISFEAMAGEAIGLIGTGGSGKSVLTRIIAGSSFPTTGEVIVNGKPAVIGSKAELNMRLTGRENIQTKCLQLGMSNKKVKTIMNSIIAFSDLENHVDRSVKTYSGRMKSKLSLAIALHQDVDIFLIDEVLPTSDKAFNQRYVDRLLDFKAQGKTILLISNSLRFMKRVCSKAVWLDTGEIKQFEEVSKVIENYQKYTTEHQELSKKERQDYHNKKKNERSIFSIDNYYEQTLSELTSSHQSFDAVKIKGLFYPIVKSSKMTLFSKLLIVIIVLGWLFIAVNYVL